MGMDYVWSGSASYPRFYCELAGIVGIFHGQGKICPPNYTFPEGTNDTLVKWFNNPYQTYYTPEETKIIWGEVRQHPEIKEISWQIWNELEKCVEFEDGWYIY